MQQPLLTADRPSGVGMGMNPQCWLKDGDVVEVSLENVGTCTNTVRFDKPKAKLCYIFCSLGVHERSMDA
jgi:hypothetical protein